MNRIIYTEGFLEDMLSVQSRDFEDKIFATIELLPSLPTLGPRALPDSLVRRYGNEVRKIAIPPFDVIYAITDADDFLVLGLVHARAVR